MKLKTLKVINIQKNKDVYHTVYMKNELGKHEMEVLKNGIISKESIKSLLLNYSNFLEYNIDSSKTAYQIFDILYKKIYS
ncbi:hypothetical protein H3N56_11425 [Cetobacterium sp. 2A]|uniref:hypothetical protein n=1 Tax=Cetobacterium sp. 2A TaxID=2754723 RepID=UPI00163B85F9|nr:hypothetical protein [Cetobacterium sp. 2A]MBC2857042.1 hypothetical protein [Cetobacterium sp. 2A]